jgi:uncharacterized tellurite resistance protein B-like protein
MLTFSTDPKVAERQMQAIIFYLTTFGYIDGDFDSAEKDFVREYIRKLVEVRVTSGMPQADETLRLELVGKFTQHFHEVFEGIDRHVRELFTEAVAKDEDQDAFIHSKLKLRCFELFQEFDDANQKVLIEAMDDLIAADGELHPAELKFRNELIDLFESDIDIDIAVTDADKKVRISEEPIEMHASQVTHPFFDQFEHHYSADPETIKQQIQGDRDLIDTMIDLLAKQAAKGAGKLDGIQKVDAFAGQEPFLDGHTYVHPVGPGARSYELTVLGDVHGCYSCLKGAAHAGGLLRQGGRLEEGPAAAQEAQAGPARRLHRPRHVQRTTASCARHADVRGRARPRLRAARQPRVLHRVQGPHLRRGQAGRGHQHAGRLHARRGVRGLHAASSSSCPTCCSSTARCSCTPASRATA